MANSEIVSTLIQVSAQVGIFGIGAYWIQKRIDKSSQLRLEEFKMTLSLLSSKSNKLHEKRFSVIEEIYSKLVGLETAMIQLTHPMKISPDLEKYENDLFNDAKNKFQDFSLYFEKSRIYFNDSTCIQIQAFLEKIRDNFLNYHEHTLFEKSEVDRETYLAGRKKMTTAFQSMTNEVPLLKTDLQNEFKKILNVD